MNLRLILCAFGWHSLVYSQRGHLDTRSKTRTCGECLMPPVDGFLMGDFWEKRPTFQPLEVPENVVLVEVEIPPNARTVDLDTWLLEKSEAAKA